MNLLGLKVFFKTVLLGVKHLTFQIFTKWHEYRIEKMSRALLVIMRRAVS